MPLQLGIIGGGVMGEALLSRLLQQGDYQAGSVRVSDPAEERRGYLSDQYGIGTTADNREILAEADTVLLAIKPQILAALRPEFEKIAAERTALLISILAGTQLSTLESALPRWPVVRAMPNTPATVGAGMTAIAAGVHAKPEHMALTQTLFEAVGSVVVVPEALLDAVTGLSGSGPAYVAMMIEAMADGGVAAGLPRAIASQLAVQTVLGTAQLIQTADLHPAILKDRVTSPGGTTIAAVAQLEKSGLRSALIQAVLAAYRRSQALGSN
ncbi:MAG: pyrroline-5-carboxylate reductase [Cyanobacteria bacterium P01_D01_bin.128]